jgi:superfamily I DNA/RNA helicase
MAWIVHEEKLDPDQKKIFNSRIDKNLWIKGFAGSGKSVLLVHKLRKVLKDNPNAQTCVVVFTWSMIDMFKTGLKELDMPTNIPVITYFKFKDLPLTNMDFIFCDEVQDLPESILNLMKTRLKPNGKIVVAGDSNQNIYEKSPGLNESTVNPKEIGKILTADEITTNYVHRVTRTIINAIQKLLPSTNIWSALREFTPQDRSIALCKAEHEEDEIEFVYKEALKGPDTYGKDRMETSVILLPTKKAITKFIQLLLDNNNASAWNEQKNKFGELDYNHLNKHLRENKIRLQYIGNGIGSLEDAGNKKDVILMTYHSSKGLDFDNVFLPFMSWDLFISKYKPDVLLMVAMTRSKKNLYITYSGNPHPLIEKFSSDKSIVSEIPITKAGKHINSSDEIELDF